MNKKPLVSFLIALYNKEEYIIECIESCLNQSYENIEVCVVDDGSTDRSLELIQSGFSTNNRVKIFSFKKNKGKVAAYNKAFELSEGNYFAFVGADDVNLIHRVSSLLDEILKTQSNLVYGNLLQTDKNLQVIKRFDGISEDISYKRVLRNNFISGGCSLFDLDLAKETFPIPEEIKFEDWWISLIAVLSYKVRFVKSDVGLYRLNESNDNLTSDDDVFLKIENNKRLLKRDFLIYKLLEKYIKEGNRIHYDTLMIKKYILLNIVYKKNYIESNFYKRIKNFTSIKFVAIDKWYIETIIITVLGSYFDFLKKKVKVIKS